MAGENYRPLLQKYDRLSNEILAEEVGPPPEGLQTWLPFYTHYMIARKLWQGRDPATSEYVEAGIDTVLDLAGLLFPPAKAGKIATQTVEKVGVARYQKRGRGTGSEGGWKEVKPEGCPTTR